MMVETNASFATRDELDRMDPEVFRDPWRFATPHDGGLDRAIDQYAKGRRIGAEYDEVSIACNGTWAAQRDSTYCTSHEVIGYHAHTADLLRGFLDSPARVVVFRYHLNGPIEIKPRSR